MSTEPSLCNSFLKEIFDFVQNKSFETIRSECEKLGIRVKESESNNLYLLNLDEDFFIEQDPTFQNLKNLINQKQEYVDLLKAESAISNSQSEIKNTIYELMTLRKNLTKLKNDLKITNKNKFTKLQMACNGLLLNKETHQIVASCLPKMFDNEDYNKPTQLGISSVEYCEDGTIIRVYYSEGVWKTATTNCINAEDSYWGYYKSFDELFWESICDQEQFIQTLNNIGNDFTHIFVLRHPDNRIVVKYDTPSLVYINSICNTNFNSTVYTSLFNIESIKPTQKLKFDNESTVESLVAKYNNPFKRGIIIRSHNNAMYRYDFSNFVTLKDLRGNQQFVRNRILELFNDKETLFTFLKHYPEYNMILHMINWTVENLAKEVHKMYIESHVKHYYTVESDHIYFKLLKQLHKSYKKSGKPILLGSVVSLIEELPTDQLKTLMGWVN
jgi:hypothetical protein